MSKKKDADKKFMEDVEQNLEKGVVHTKTKEEKLQEKADAELHQRNTYLGAVVLLSATFQKLLDLQELGATKMRTKNLVNQTIKSMEHDLDTIFDIKDKDIEKKKAEGVEVTDRVGQLMDAHSDAVLKLVDKLLNE